MKPIYIILSLLVLSLTGCVTIVKWKYGITNPREQTPEKIISFLERHAYPDSCQFIFNDSLAYFQGLRNPVFRKNLIGHMIFDGKGSLLQHDTAQCQWSGYDVIRSLNPDSVYLNLNGLQLADILDHIHPIGSNPGQDPKLLHPDFTIIVTWAAFLGTYSARLFELSEAVKENTTGKVRLIWLNIDMQESWKLTKDQKMEIR
jgi:hypothetical protein